MSTSDAHKPAGGFQYRLRFFHKCRCTSSCDPGQLDRVQVQGSVLESTCGAPIIVVLVRYRNDPESGLSKECQRAQFPPDKSPFAVKAIVVPADRVLEYMDKPLLEQPHLQDATGRNLIGGPDVSPSGEIYATPLESNGIAHLNNFCIALPWSEQDPSLPQQQQQQESRDALNHHKNEWHHRSSGGGAASAAKATAGAPDGAGASPAATAASTAAASGPERSRMLGEGSRVMQCSSDGRSSGARPELCLVVQLLRRDTSRPGRWFGYDMPHLVSRPFQVLSRNAWMAMHYPLLTTLATAPQPHAHDSAAQPYPLPSGLLKHPQPRPYPYPYRNSSFGGSGFPRAGSPRPLASLSLGNGDGSAWIAQRSLTAGFPSASQQQQQQQQQGFRSANGAFFSSGGGGLGGMEPQVAGFVMGATGGGAVGGDHRRSSTSGGSPHVQRNSRTRRRSCLSRDSCHEHDDASMGAAPSVGGQPPAARTPSGVSAAEVTTCSGPLAPGAAQSAVEARAQAGTPCSLPRPLPQQHSASAFAGSSAVPLAVEPAEQGDGGQGAGTDEGAGEGAGELGLGLGLPKASSAMLLDINVTELLNSVVEAQNFFGEDAMDDEGAAKRVKSNSSEPCAPAHAHLSGTSSTSLMTTYPSDRAHHTDAGAAAATTGAGIPVAAEQVPQRHPDPRGSCGGGSRLAQTEDMAAAGGASCTSCSVPMPFVARHSDCTGSVPFAARTSGSGGQMPFVTRQSDCGGSGGGSSAGGGRDGGGAAVCLPRQLECGSSWKLAATAAAVAVAVGGRSSEQEHDMAALRKQSTGLSGTTGICLSPPCNTAAAPPPATGAGAARPPIATPFGGLGVAALCSSSAGAASGSDGAAASQLDTLMALLGQPGALQEVLDRMDEDEQQLQ